MRLPTPTELQTDPGLIGEILRQFPRPLLEESETRGNPWTWLAKRFGGKSVEFQCHLSALELNGEVAKCKQAGFQKAGVGVWRLGKKYHHQTRIREVRFFSCKNDANKYHQQVILDGRLFRKVFNAAASQKQAIRRLGEAASGGGSIFTSYRSLLVQALKRGDQTAATHFGNKVSASIFRTPHGRHWLMEDRKTPLPIRREARRRYDDLYARAVRKLGRKKADETFAGAEQGVRFKLKSDCDKICVAMATGWLSLPGGFPGFCFMSDKVVAMLLGLMLPLPSLLTRSGDYQPWKTIRTYRERIRLKKAEVVVNRLDVRPNGDWGIFDGRDRCLGILAWSKALPPKL